MMKRLAAGDKREVERLRHILSSHKPNNEEAGESCGGASTAA